jgi:putative glutamine amidotransferase
MTTETNSDAATASRKATSPKIGITDTLYAQIRFSVANVGAEPVDLVTPETLKAMFLDAPRPTLLTEHMNAELVSVDVSHGEPYVRRRWDVSNYKEQDGILDAYVTANRSKFEKPCDATFLAPLINMEYVRKQVSQLDGLLVGGGEDVNPRFYSEKDLQLPGAKGGIEENVYARTRDVIELAYISEALSQDKPILGICRGSQILAVALGAKIVQDIPSSFPILQNRHSMHSEFEKSEGHFVSISSDSVFAKIMRLDEVNAGSDVTKNSQGYAIGVNSYHHQAVIEDFPGITVQARDCSGTKNKEIVEGYVAKGTENLVMGVQWHPERPYATAGSSVAASSLPLTEWKQWFERDERRPYYRRMFEYFVNCAGKNPNTCTF